jgi:hypothetical protein
MTGVLEASATVSVVGWSIGVLTSRDPVAAVPSVDRLRSLAAGVLIVGILWGLHGAYPHLTFAGPLFVFAGLAGSALTTGAALRTHPLTEGMGYWRRVAFGFRQTRLLREHAQQRRATDVRPDDGSKESKGLS